MHTIGLKERKEKLLALKKLNKAVKHKIWSTSSLVDSLYLDFISKAKSMLSHQGNQVGTLIMRMKEMEHLQDTNDCEIFQENKVEFLVKELQ